MTKRCAAAGMAMALVALTGVFSGRSAAGEAKWLELADAEAAEKPGLEVQTPKADEAKAECEWTKPVPLSFNIDYVLVSDYIFRGVNASEYAGEGREKPNHQMSVNIEYDAGDWGAVGGNFWFEWFAGQKHLTPDYDGHTQEIDFTVYWSRSFDEIGTTVETGWLAYVLPPLKGDDHTDYEWYLQLSYDDSKIFGTESPVLNPYAAYYQDLDVADGTSWWEFGVSHPFALGDWCKDTPIIKDITLTPSLVMGVNHRYYQALGIGTNPSTKIANLNYGLDLSYDLSSALKLPPQYGTLAVGGFINYSQAIEDVIEDEFYGGTKVSYAW